MNIFRSMADVKINRKQGIAIGTFDGLHLGHIKLLEELVVYCKKNDLESLVYTFSNHPRSLSSTKEGPKRLLSLERKIEEIESIGIDNLVLLEFDDEQKNIEPKLFIKDILLNRLQGKFIVVGEDFRFGKKAQGSVEMLDQYKKRYNYKLNIVKELQDNKKKISSTYIRALLAQGEIAKANELLGRRFLLSGEVIGGRQIGRTLGFPTANIANCPKMTIIKSGVYLTEIIIDGKKFISVTNVGDNPTFKDRDYSVETHILDFSEDIYGKTVTVEFLHRLRDEETFAHIDELVAAIKQDIYIAKDIYNKKYV